MLKATYSFVDNAYIHLDEEGDKWIVSVEMKPSSPDSVQFSEKDFLNEMLVQTLRHEVYQQTKNIREMLCARSIASSLMLEPEEGELNTEDQDEANQEDKILTDWFESR